MGRWLGSTKNIVGALLGVLALGAHLVWGLGAFWPFVVVASYAVGALVAPRDRVDLRLGFGEGATADQLAEQLRVLRRSVRSESRRLTPQANDLLGAILGSLEQIVARWDELAGAADQRHTVEQMILDYLPTSVQTFVNLPKNRALTRQPGQARSPHDELVEQLTLLQQESTRIENAVYAREIEALGDHSRFLRDKFTRSSLDLGS